MFRFIGNLVSPGNGRGKLAILVYHRMLPERDELLSDEIDTSVFEGHMRIAAACFNVLPLREACVRLERGTLPPRALCVTFDDGYADNEAHALPILERFGVPATFFVATGYTGGGLMFNDAVIAAVRGAAPGTYDLSHLGAGVVALDGIPSRRAAMERMLGAVKFLPTGEREARVRQIVETLRVRLPAALMMTPRQIERLHRAGMEIGSHTVRHPVLASVSDEEARAELVESKRVLEDIIGARVTSFAYPNGKPGRDYGLQHARLAKEAGYALAVSTRDGVAGRGADMFHLPRMMPWERKAKRFAARLLLACARSGPTPPVAQAGVPSNALQRGGQL